MLTSAILPTVINYKLIDVKIQTTM